MTKRPEPFVSPTGGPPRGGETPRAVDATLDRFLGIQRPVVLGHLRGLRKRHPDATALELAGILERRYVAAVTTGGAAVGATAVIPAIGTGVTLALSGLETAGFLEATALYAQSLSELHGIAVDDPARARALVLTMMLGREGSDLVRQLAGQVTGAGVTRTAYWGELVTTTLPSMVVGPLVDRLRNVFIRQFAVRGGASIIARAIPFGIGAVVGGTGNHILGRRVVMNSRLAFGPAPLAIPEALAPVEGPGAVRRLGAGTGRRVVRAGTVLRSALPGRIVRRGKPGRGAAELEGPGELEGPASQHGPARSERPAAQTESAAAEESLVPGGADAPDGTALLDASADRPAER
ncbi:hypothetical protein [Leifsonia shinshuensis]|uniref:EcsC family protein n=2 Tax=Leifsonia shinshuensis TaxID=150026 RepID=A0A853D1G1_9MICO|nr:hypothetical protein [Leifsonia shinshuensis]NYJ24565.1 hypothetical protein [Leifsonia shinshuensis]